MVSTATMVTRRARDLDAAGLRLGVAAAVADGLVEADTTFAGHRRLRLTALGRAMVGERSQSQLIERPWRGVGGAAAAPVPSTVERHGVLIVEQPRRGGEEPLCRSSHAVSPLLRARRLSAISAAVMSLTRATISASGQSAIDSSCLCAR